jgi:S-DNA-T family DNA segregation ATPase FtsK/SpoIIIE
MEMRNWTGYLVPTEHRRLNEFVGLLVLTFGILLALSLVSFNPDDPSFNISQNPQFAAKPTNFVGVVGAYGADIFFQTWGYSAFLLPVFLGIYAFYWLASWPVKNFGIRLSGMILMTLTIATTLEMSPWRIHDHILPGGLCGKILADTLQASLNITGAVIILISAFLVSLLLSTTFSFAGAVTFLKPHFRFVSNLSERWSNWQEERARQKALQKPDTKKEKTLKKQTIVTEKPRHIEEPAALLDEPEYERSP